MTETYYKMETTMCYEEELAEFAQCIQIVALRLEETESPQEIIKLRRSLSDNTNLLQGMTNEMRLTSIEIERLSSEMQKCYDYAANKISKITGF